MTQEIIQKTDVTFSVDANQRYACENCPAKCCRFPWKITVTPEEHARYMDTPWIVEHLKDAGTELVPQDDGGFVMPSTTKSDGSRGCVFLDDANMCTMQHAEGHLFIPKTCQHYPFGFIKDEEAQEVKPIVSYFCRSILHNYGAPVADLVADRYQFYLKDHTVPTIPAAMALGDVAIEKDAYLHWLDYVQGLFSVNTLSAGEALMVTRRMLSRMMHELPDGSLAAMDKVIAETNATIEQNKDYSEALQGSLPAQALVAIENVTFVINKDITDEFRESNDFKIGRGYPREDGEPNFQFYFQQGRSEPVEFGQAGGFGGGEKYPG